MKFMDMMNGVLCSLIANVNRGPDTDPYKSSDFMIVRDKPQDDISQEEHPEMIEPKLKALVASGLVREVKNG